MERKRKDVDNTKLIAVAMATKEQQDGEWKSTLDKNCLNLEMYYVREPTEVVIVDDITEQPFSKLTKIVGNIGTTNVPRKIVMTESAGNDPLLAPTIKHVTVTLTKIAAETIVVEIKECPKTPP